METEKRIPLRDPASQHPGWIHFRKEVRTVDVHRIIAQTDVDDFADGADEDAVGTEGNDEEDPEKDEDLDEDLAL
ncbi:MAG: hypothetical protein A2991_02390 [Candidatus Terrybacteria bacterium RIFCSPLOWO2_01_FULL_58_14]|uniref:Uncharacterized protein n=1 Tax=Candidatus Terrybacteria bacterium RIFCSPLOWO2_01_FULL_58_14 TaxID=1802369 RepID=A0A1G2Q0B7_9BACT|nr:MAG: hypothetical protein A2991_02390 [Candidatus Terrybacteria bacterium RIFCSPLOWO2_01_FULL_58_14]